MELFNKQKKWYKGNLHTHTTRSDGAYSVEECIDAYRKRGYDFLCITDHRKYFQGYESEDFIVIPGTELHYHDDELRKAFHITGINIKKEIPTDDTCKPQYIIDLINEAGGIAVMAHPAWSLLTHDDTMNLNGLTAIEIFNTLSEAYSCRGYSDNYADVLASKGYVKNLLAVDDAHFYDKDAFQGWIMVQCNDLNADSIVNAIIKGKYYSTQGPEFKQISVNGDTITAETSPVAGISFISDTFYVRERVVESDGLITEGRYKIKKTDRVVRVEITDADGKKAWSNYIVL
ncbi:MAG: PHP domain-containing protein [Caldicoprobacterales bacterium]